MSVTDGDLRAAWQHGSTDVPSDRSACLNEVEWARLLAKEANEEERAWAADHISSCMECASEYRLLSPLQSWATEIQGALRRDNKAQRSDSAGWRKWFSSPRPAVALAALAVLLVLQAVGLYFTIGSRRQNAQLEAQLGQERDTLSSTRALLGMLQEELRRRPVPQTAEELGTLQQRLARLSAPQLDVPIVDLDPRNAGSVRGSVDPQAVTPDPDASFVALILNFEQLMSRATLEVEVIDEIGQTRWVGRTAREPSTASLTLALPTDSYPAGRYDVRVSDVTRGRTLLATYAVIIRAAKAP